MTFRHSIERFNTRLLIGVFATLFLSTPLSAAMIDWTFVDVTFSDGGSLSGGFTYDADTNDLSSWNITTTASGSFDGFNYTPSSSVIYTVNADGFQLDRVAGGYGFLDVFFLGNLTDTVGYVDIKQGDVASCSSTIYKVSCEGSSTGSSRVIIAGSLSAVPVPAAAWLFGSGLVGLIGVARRKARA